jgi:hypothetical protein
MTLSFDLPLKCPLRVDPAAFRPDPHAGFAKYRPLAGVIEFGGSARRHAAQGRGSLDDRSAHTPDRD